MTPRPSRSVEAPGESHQRYRKVRQRWWADLATQRLTTEQKLVALYCLTGPQSNGIGVYRFSPGQASEDLGEGFTEGFGKAFTEACRAHGWKFDPVARVLWIPGWIRDNAPQSPNVVKSWHGQLDLVPDCGLKHEAIQALTVSLQGFGEAFLQAFGKGLGEGFGSSLPNQEQEQEQDQETDQEHTLGPTPQPSPASAVPQTSAPSLTLAPPETAPHTGTGDGFAEFWADYPRKVSRTAAAAAWKKLAPNRGLQDRIRAGLARWNASSQWREVIVTDPERRRIPHAATWLNQRRWEDVIAASPTPSSPGGPDMVITQKELLRLLDAAGINRHHRALYFDGASVQSDQQTGIATLVLADERRREAVTRSFGEALEGAVIAQGGRKLRIVGSVAA